MTTAAETRLKELERKNRNLAGPLVHPRDRGVQFSAIRLRDRLLETGIDSTFDSRGDANDNALAESINALHRAEVIYHQRPSKSQEDVEYATPEWVASSNCQRLMDPLGNVRSAEYEAQRHQQHARAQADHPVAVLNQQSRGATEGNSQFPHGVRTTPSPFRC